VPRAAPVVAEAEAAAAAAAATPVTMIILARVRVRASQSDELCGQSPQVTLPGFSGVFYSNVLVGLPIIRGIRSTVWVTHDTDVSVKSVLLVGVWVLQVTLVSAKCGSRTHFWCYIDTQWDLVTPRCDPGRWFTISVDN
jgi:hypothetical protein